MPSVEDEYNEILAGIGKRLTELRLEKGYAKRTDFISKHQLPAIQYWRMEKGTANVTLKSLIKILAIHGMTLEEFFSNKP